MIARAEEPLTSSPCSTQWPALLLPLRLEVRRIADDGGLADDLCIRVLPDQPFVNMHKEALSSEEASAGETLRAVVSGETPDESGEKARGEWAELARRYGPARAAWILHALLHPEPSNAPNDDLVAIPTLFLLPQRFRFMVYENDQLVYDESGQDLIGPYTLLPAPPPTPPDPATPPADGLFDEASRWVSNFDAAVLGGLGIRIPLITRHRAAPKLRFSEIVVVGLASGDESTGIQAFEQFVATHRFSDGFEFLRYGTPTNNTQQGESGHSQSEDELIASFDIEVAPPGARADTVADQLAKALGLPANTEVFKHIKGADLAPHPPLRLMLDTLWPCTGDYFYSEMLGYRSFADERARLRQYVLDYVRPGGHFAAVRVGNMPYGILPATRTTGASARNPSGWKPSSIDHQTDGDAVDWLHFDEALLRTLRMFLPLWLARAKNSGAVPRAGTSQDPDDELVRLLGMAPHSVDCNCRPVVDQTLILVLYQLFKDTLFGINSSFEEFFNAAPGVRDSTITRQSHTTAPGKHGEHWVHGVNPPTAAAAWGYAWQQSWQARREQYQALGIAPHLKYYAPLLRAFMWGETVPCGMDLVRVPMPPVIEGTTPPAQPPTIDGPEIYFPLFVSGQPPSPNASKTLLFDLVRRSLDLAPDVRATFEQLRDYPIVEFFSHTGTLESLDALAARDPAIDPGELGPAHAALHGTYADAAAVRTAFGSDAAGLFDELARRLTFDFTGTLENGLRDLIDGLTYRLDAWWTTLAKRRLDGMRAANPTPGLHWGAYGYLEDITLAKHQLNIIERQTGAGYIHAPTIGQASAAALLRNAYVTHRNDPDGNPYAVNLTSKRVNRALALIDGVQQGQDLSALLGYQFERGLHDAGLDRAIDAFRTAFPVSPPDDADKAEAAETIGARDVCDGRALANAMTASDPKVETTLHALDVPDGRQSIHDRDEARALIADLRDANDAVGDLLLYEGIYQAVQGNVERSGAALDACAGIGRPPEIESVATPSVGPNLRHRVCLFIPPDDTPSSTAERAKAEPRLNRWLERVLGPLANITCCAIYTPADDQTSECYVSLADLEISALDFVYMCHTLPAGDGDTELETRLRRGVRQVRAVQSNSTITLRLEDARLGTRSMAHALELGRAFLDLLGNIAVVTPPNLTRPDDAPSRPFYNQTEVDAIGRRASNAYTSLSALSLDLSNVARQPAALEGCAQFGISDAVVEHDDDPSIPDRAASVLAVVTKRLAAAKPLVDTAKTGDAKLDDSVAALKALFGEGFVVLPACDASGTAIANRADFDATLPPAPGEDRLWLWFQQVAETHPQVRRFETFLIAAEGWGVITPSLAMAQLPRDEGVQWQALSDDEMGIDELERATTKRPPGMLSIVAVTPTNLDPGALVGFVIDEWTETMPASSATTGISFEYDQPASQAPQCFLLAVPGNFDQAEWTAEHLAGIVRDTMELAKARLVDLDAVPNVGGLTPALMFPIPQPPVVYYVDPGYSVYAVP